VYISKEVHVLYFSTYYYVSRDALV